MATCMLETRTADNSATRIVLLRIATAVIIAALSCVGACAQQFSALTKVSAYTKINNLGQVIGWQKESDTSQSVIKVDIATQIIATARYVGAIDIDDHGGVLHDGYGYSYRAASGAITHLDAGDFSSDGSAAVPVGINNSGLIAGNFYHDGPGDHWHFAYTVPVTQCPLQGSRGGDTTQLPDWCVGLDEEGIPWQHTAYATALNDSGTTIGYNSWWHYGLRISHIFRSAAYWTGTTVHEIGTLGYSSSEATAINNNGDITGVLYNADDSVAHAFLFSEDTTQELTNFNEKPLAMNDLGVILSATSFYDNGIVTPIQSLLPEGWTLGAASDINDSNQVVGYAIGPDSLQHGFILQVPEPTTMCLMGLGTLALLRRRHAKTRG